MATITKTFTFDSDNEGFTLTETVGSGTIQRDTSNGSPTNGSIQQIGQSGRNKVSEGQGLIDNGTWESIFGIPAGSTINSIQIEDVRTYAGLTHWTTPIDNVDWSVHITESTGVTSVTGTDPIWSRNVTAQDSGWNSAGQQTAQNVTATYQASNTTIDLFFHINTDNANGSSAQASGHLDYISITIDYSAGSTTYSGSVTADAVIESSQSGSFTADAVRLASASASITGDATVEVSQAGSFTTDSIVQAAVTGAVVSDALVLAASVGGLVADAVVLETRSGSFSADAVVGASGTTAVWVSPANLSTMEASPVLVFTSPSAATKDMHFQIQLDTDSGFSAPSVHQSPGTGWEYWDGDSWEPIPASGMPSSAAGNNARYTVQSPLAQNTWYRRVRAGVIS